MRLMILALVFVGVVSAQVYTNAAYNTHYEAPAGWVLDTPEIVDGVINLTTTRVGLQPVTMRCSKVTTNYEGYLSPGEEICFRLARVYNVITSTQAPTLTFIQDTTIGLIHYTGLVVKQIDQDFVLVEYAASNQVYMHTYIYSTTLSDYSTNNSLYAVNWQKLQFISLTGPATKITAAPRIPQSESNNILVDLLGRRAFAVKPEKSAAASFLLNRP